MRSRCGPTFVCLKCQSYRLEMSEILYMNFECSKCHGAHLCAITVVLFVNTKTQTLRIATPYTTQINKRPSIQSVFLFRTHFARQKKRTEITQMNKWRKRIALFHPFLSYETKPTTWHTFIWHSNACALLRSTLLRMNVSLPFRKSITLINIMLREKSWNKHAESEE